MVLSNLAPTLKYLALNKLKKVGELRVCPLAALHNIYFLDSVTVSSDNLCAVVSKCPNLRSFYGADLGGKDDCLHALAQHCRSLRALQYGRAAPGSTPGLAAVLYACPDLRLVGFLSAEEISDQHFLAVRLHRPLQITSLNLQFSGDTRLVTDTGLEKLLADFKNLKLLRLAHLYCTSDAVLHSLVHYCSGLGTGLRGALPERSLVSFFPRLSALMALDLQGVTWLSDAVMTAIAAHCKRLEIIVLIDAHGFTEEGIVALAKGCAALKDVYINEEHPVLGYIGELMWQAFRPDLAFPDIKALWNPWNHYCNEL